MTTTAATEPTLEPDSSLHGPQEDFPASESDTASSSASLASTVLNYQHENGRRYHAFRSGNYPLPNDEAEQDRLDLTHHLFTMLLGGEIYRAPIKEGEVKRILDVGTGTG